VLEEIKWPRGLLIPGATTTHSYRVTESGDSNPESKTPFLEKSNPKTTCGKSLVNAKNDTC
jgi:hypothetical protein